MSDFIPTIYVKENCPFCLKVRIAILEAGLENDVAVKEFSPGTEGEIAIKEELAPHFDKVIFPSAQIEPGKYISDSDAIVDALLGKANVDKMSLPVLNSYVNGAFKGMMDLYRENRELQANRERVRSVEMDLGRTFDACLTEQPPASNGKINRLLAHAGLESPEGPILASWYAVRTSALQL